MESHFFYRYGLILQVLIYILLASSCASSSKAVVPYDYLTPQMFGALGDGINDDTKAVRQAIYESSKKGKILYLPSGKKYRVKGTLNYIDGKYVDIKLNILGCIPVKDASYTPLQSGGIIVEKGVKLFHKATISGSIERVCITGQRDLNVHFFDDCECKGLVISGCNISNFGALFYNSSLNSVSQIINNTFLTVFYFAKNDNSSCGMTDSFISFNYINGGAELNDNSCFEWSNYNACSINNNFIDYYRTIYCPKAVSKQAFVGPQSYSNQYQVFRYFYMPGDDNIGGISFTSVSDSFNWNDPQTLKKLQEYKVVTYVGNDGTVYEIPPYVANCSSTWVINIENAKIESNMSSLVFVNSSLTEYEHNRFEVTFVGNNPYKKGQINYRQGDVRPFYNSGKYITNSIRLSGIIEVLDKLPSTSIGWSSSVQGRTVKVGEKVYRSANKKQGNKWKSEWEEIAK